MQRMIFRNTAVLAIAALTLLTLSCGTSRPEAANSQTAQPTASSVTGVPATDGEPSAEPSTSTPGVGLAPWLADADNICRLAITQYKQAKAGISADNPEGLAYAAALATRTASDGFAEITAPTEREEARILAAQVHKFADDEQALAAAMRSGSFADEDSAFDELEAAGQELADTANALGVESCAAMTREV